MDQADGMKDQSSKVYSREEYAKPSFWNDRFKESKGFFDWYANWKEIKPMWEQMLRADVLAEGNQDHILMVGCGNSRMSEEMAQEDSYQNIVNMDISHLVLEKMKLHTDKEKFAKCHNFQHVAMDATNMDFRDGVFDVVVDKGTYDALACDETNKTMICNLTKEMMRVTRKGGAVVIITNGIPVKRLSDLQSFTSDYSTKIEYSKIDLSQLSQMINIMRSNLGNKPLSSVMKDTKVLKYTLDEMVKIKKLKKEEALLADPKTKMFGMFMKAARLQREKDEQKQEEIATQKKDEEESLQQAEEGASKEEVPPAEEAEKPKSTVKYNPKRQDFCMMYVLYKN